MSRDDEIAKLRREVYRYRDLAVRGFSLALALAREACETAIAEEYAQTLAAIDEPDPLEGLLSLGIMRLLSDRDLETLVQLLDDLGNGFVSREEVAAFVERALDPRRQPEAAA